MKVIILAGGLGTRLREVIGTEVPKPMAAIHGKPFLYYLLKKIHLEGFSDVMISCGYKADTIVEYIRSLDVLAFGLRMQTIVEDPEHLLGTGGAIRNVAKYIDEDHFLVVNGDTYCSVDLMSIARAHLSSRADMTMVLYRHLDASRYGVVEIDSNHAVVGFSANGSASGLVNSGVYVFNRDLFVSRDCRGSSLEKEILPRLIHQGARIHGIVWDGYFIDIGVPTDFRQFSKDLETIGKADV